jgi:hypothetical protein
MIVLSCVFAIEKELEKELKREIKEIKYRIDKKKCS